MPPSCRKSHVLSDEFGVFTKNEYSSRSFLLLSARDLLKREPCLTLLLKWSDQMQTDTAVAASQLAKQYSFSVALPALYAMSALNERINFSLDNVLIHIGTQDQTSFELHLRDWETISLQGDRGVKREQLLKTLFTHHISPLWNHLQQLTGISRFVLWENLAVYVYWLYEEKLNMNETGADSFARDDFHHLLFNVPSGMFQEKIQPLKHFYHPPDRSSGSEKPVRFRKTCCLYYLTNAGRKCCSNCPRLQKKDKKSKTI